MAILLQVPAARGIRGAEAVVVLPWRNAAQPTAVAILLQSQEGWQDSENATVCSSSIHG